MAFDAKHKKAVASDAKLATTMAGSANFEDALYHCIERNCPNIKLQNMLFAKKWTPNSICLLFLQYCLLALTNLLSCFKIVGNRS